MADDVQDIKDKLNIVDYIKPIVALTPAGKNFKGLCPFHKEKTPSFMVSPDRQIWHCFGGCNAGGDIFSFVMKYENVEFYEALKILAEKAGIELKRAGGEFQKYNRIYEVNEAAKNLFRRSLINTSSAHAYLKERGLKEETVEEFEIGLALSGIEGLAGESSDFLLRNLVKEGFSVEEIDKAGLVFRTERGTYWDRFRHRLMFPLYNHQGKVVGFTGRILDDSQKVAKVAVASKVSLINDTLRANANQNFSPKYVNSPETPIFQKSKFMYGFHKSKNFIREANEAILVEGQMDFLMSWQDGLKNVVATSGTALTNDHLQMLKRYCDRLVLSFDNDSAGQSAAERSIDSASANDFSVKVLSIPSGKDPADVARAQPGLMAQLASAAVPAIYYYFNRYPAIGRDIYQKKKNLRVILSKIKNIASVVERSSWLKELSGKIGLDEQTLIEEMENLKVLDEKRSDYPELAKSQVPVGLRKDIIVKRIFGIVYHHPDLMKLVEEYKEFVPAAYQGTFDAAEIVDVVSLQIEGSEEELRQLLEQLKIEFYKHRQKSLRLAMHRAEIADEEKNVERIRTEFDTVSRELHNTITKSHAKEEIGGQKDKKNNKEDLSKDSEQDDWF